MTHTQHLNLHTNTSCYTHSHMYASWHRYREWVTTYWPLRWSWSSVQICKRKSIVHTHTWTYKHTQLLTGHHDGLWVPSQTVLEQPSQHRVTIRDERLLPPFDWIRHIRWTNKTTAHNNITWHSSSRGSMSSEWGSRVSSEPPWGFHISTFGILGILWTTFEV